MQYLNFVSKKISFSSVSIDALLFMQGFSWLFINCLTFSLRLHNLLFLNMLINLAEKESPPHVLRNILYQYDCSIWISNELPVLPFECNKRPLPSNKQKHDSIFLNSSSSYNSRWLHYIILQLSHNSLTLYLICFGFLNFW